MSTRRSAFAIDAAAAVGSTDIEGLDRSAERASQDSDDDAVAEKHRCECRPALKTCASAPTGEGARVASAATRQRARARKSID